MVIYVHVQSNLSYSKGIFKQSQIKQVITEYRFNEYGMYCEKKLKSRSHNTSYCLIEVVTKAGVTVYDTVSGCCLMQNEQFFCYHGKNSLHSMRYFVLDQHAQIDFLQCQCTETTVYRQMIAPPRHNNSMLCVQWRSRKYQFYRLWFDPTGAYPRSAALDESMIAITPVMQFM